MRAIVAKRIRKEVYGDQSLKRRHTILAAVGKFNDRRFIECGQSMICTGLRRAYLDAKAEYKAA
jgi:hypothetical protein